MVGMPGASEWIILLILAIFLFGAKRIPELARNLGRAKGEFQAGIKDVTSPSRAEVDMDRGGVSDEVANENE
jgi:sec-independent protein translocase protein TatA